MPTFRIPATWHCSHTFTVIADTVERAVEMVEDAQPPFDNLPPGDYIDDSFRIDQDLLEELNPRNADETHPL